jgi:hypothetical protein
MANHVQNFITLATRFLTHEMFMPRERAKLYNEMIFLVETSIHLFAYYQVYK